MIYKIILEIRTKVYQRSYLFYKSEKRKKAIQSWNTWTEHKPTCVQVQHDLKTSFTSHQLNIPRSPLHNRLKTPLLLQNIPQQQR